MHAAPQTAPPQKHHSTAPQLTKSFMAFWLPVRAGSRPSRRRAENAGINSLRCMHGQGLGKRSVQALSGLLVILLLPARLLDILSASLSHTVCHRASYHWLPLLLQKGLGFRAVFLPGGHDTVAICGAHRAGPSPGSLHGRRRASSCPRGWASERQSWMPSSGWVTWAILFLIVLGLVFGAEGGCPDRQRC